MSIETGIEPGATFRLQGALYTYRLTGQESDGKVAQVEVTADSQVFFAPPQLHENEDECVYIIEGRCLVQIGTDVFEAAAGQSLFMPRGMPHAIANAGDRPARLILTLTPAGAEPYFAELSQTMDGVCPLPTAAFSDVDGFIERTVPQLESEIVMNRLMALWSKYGMKRAPGA